MSDPHASAHDHEPEPSEISHPLLWTLGLVAIAAFLVWLFFHCMSIGRTEARGEETVEALIPPPAMTVDLKKLATDTSPAFLAKGKHVFDANCATCHGINGDLKGATTQNARNFRADCWKNPNGGGPYALYLVVTNGFNGDMPSFQALDPESRMAAVQYVREEFVKKYNPANYVPADPPELTATIPAPGSATGSGPAIPPNERTPPRELYPLLAATADAANGADREIEAWADALPLGAAEATQADCQRLRSLCVRDPGLAERLRERARHDDEQGFTALLTAPAAPGVDLSAFAVASQERLHDLFQAARAAAEGSH